jgi:hypothetical protein
MLVIPYSHGFFKIKVLSFGVWASTNGMMVRVCACMKEGQGTVSSKSFMAVPKFK